MSQRNADDMGMPSPLPMTQPISPDEGDALKACPWCNGDTRGHYTMPERFVRHHGEPHCPVSRGEITAAQWNFRTDPPVAMDEVEALAKEFEKVDGYRGDIHRTLARIALTRIKDSSK